MCAYCKIPLTRLEATTDHVLPKARGGGNTKDNLVVACKPCNFAKGNKVHLRWVMGEHSYFAIKKVCWVDDVPRTVGTNVCRGPQVKRCLMTMRRCRT